MSEESVVVGDLEVKVAVVDGLSRNMLEQYAEVVSNPSSSAEWLECNRRHLPSRREYPQKRGCSDFDDSREELMHQSSA